MSTMQENTATATTLGQRTAALRQDVGQLEVETAMGENVPADVLSDARAERDFLEVLSFCREDRLGQLETEWMAAHYPTVSGPLERGQSGRAWIAGQRVAPVVNVPTRTDRALAARIAGNAVALERIADRILALEPPKKKRAPKVTTAPKNVSRGLKVKPEAEYVPALPVADAADMAAFHEGGWDEVDAMIALEQGTARQR